MRPSALLPLAVLLALAEPAAAEDLAGKEGPATERAEAPAPKEPEKAKEGPKTAEAVRGRFVVVHEGPAALEPVGAAEVAFEPEAYGGELEVVEAFAGGPVEAGQVLVRFSTEKVDEQIEALARDVEIATRAFARQGEEAKRAKDASEAGLARATLSRDRAERALRRFVEQERAMRASESALRLKGTDDAIADHQKEHDQLVKMYGKGDAVEETEEIVLERSLRHLERMKVNREFQAARHKWFVEVELADEQRALELSAAKEQRDLDLAKATADLALEQSRLELAKAEANLRKQTKALGDLRRDREALVLKAPRAGLAVPGACVRGKWQGVEETRKELVPGGKLKARTPVFTVVEPGAVVLRAAVPEARVLGVRPGLAVEVRPTADDRRRLAGRVASVATTGGEGGFAVTVELDERDARLLPGYTAKVRLRVREEDGVLTVPASAVVADGEKRVVHVVPEEGRPAPREVKVGDVSEGRAEVLEGLEAGERVLESPPKK